MTLAEFFAYFTKKILYSNVCWQYLCSENGKAVNTASLSVLDILVAKAVEADSWMPSAKPTMN